MNFALQKTLELLLIIALGLFLQRKVAKQDLKGVKTLILSIALPATIFVALLKIELDSSLLMYPIVALAFNLAMMAAGKFLFGFTFSNDQKSVKKRTLMMLLPSLAPGLSCFPFIIVYLGDEFLALAALADVGNKIFGLILLYLVAIHWYHSRAIKKVMASTSSKIKSLLFSMLNEPINLVISIGLVLLAFGVTINSFPTFIENTIVKMSVIMTPLVLLFIGMAVRIKFKEFGLIFSMLVRRSGIAFLLSSVVVFLFPTIEASMVLLIIAFPQSSCSFWPFAHMSAISSLEEKYKQPSPTFDIDFAVNILACSLPFSTVLIISIFSMSDFFVNPMLTASIGVVFFLFSFVPVIIFRVRSNKKAILFHHYIGLKPNTNPSKNQ